MDIDRIPGMPTRIRRAFSGIGTTFVPYLGAIKNTDLGAFNLSTTGSLTAANLNLSAKTGINFTYGTDEDVNIIELSGITGTPKLYWDESEDRFRVTTGFFIDVNLGVLGAASISGLTTTGTLSVTGLAAVGELDVDTLNFSTNVISDSTGTISFDDDNLTTSGSLDADGLTIGTTSGGTITDIKDEDDMASDSQTALATQQSIKAYIDTGLTGYVPYTGATANVDLGSFNLETTGTIIATYSSSDVTVFNETFTYANGRLETVSSGVWQDYVSLNSGAEMTRMFEADADDGESGAAPTVLDGECGQVEQSYTGTSIYRGDLSDLGTTYKIQYDITELFHKTGVGSSSAFIYCVFRVANDPVATHQYYSVRIMHYGSSNLVKLSLWDVTGLGTVAQVGDHVTIADTDTIYSATVRIEIEDNSCKVFIDDVEKLSETIANYTSQKIIGFGFYIPETVNKGHIDNVLVTTAGTGNTLVISENTISTTAGELTFDSFTDTIEFNDNDLTTTGDITGGNLNVSDWDTGFYEVGGVVLQYNGGYDEDFVFGSPQLADDGNADHDARMWFDKSKGAFRAGEVTGAEWDDVNVGGQSTAFGNHTMASGANSFAIGAATASGTNSFAGEHATASGNNSFAWGENVIASGTYCTAIGYDFENNEIYSFAIGFSAKDFIFDANNFTINADNHKIQFGAAQDAYIEFDGDSLNIVANAITGTDNLLITANLVDLGSTPLTTGGVIEAEHLYSTNDAVIDDYLQVNDRFSVGDAAYELTGTQGVLNLASQFPTLRVDCIRTSTGGLAFNFFDLFATRLPEDSQTNLAKLGFFGAFTDPPTSKYLYMGARGTTAYNDAFVKIDATDRMALGLSGNTRPTTAMLEVYGNCMFGDGATNYAAFADDGILTLAGTARVTNALWIGAEGMKAPPTKPAAFVDHGISGAWEFSDATDDTIVATMRIPDKMDRGVAPNITLGWSSTTQSAFCEWQIEYLWRSPNEDTTVGADDTLLSSTDADTSTSSATAEGMVVSTFPLVAPSATDTCLHLRIKRRADLAADTINGDTTELHGICMSFTSNKLGTAT